MSTSVFTDSILEEIDSDPPAQTADLSDIFDLYVVPENQPSADWMTKLHWERPRRTIRCLPESTRRLKRLMDLVIAGTMLMVLSPVMLLVALAVRLTSRGPIIFCQERVGLNLREKRNDRRAFRQAISPTGVDRRQETRRQTPAYGQSFILYKFRTMRIDAEKYGAQFAVKNDPRVTPIGHFLRKTRLDELPQLWNVLRGEMSLVGPRPERPVFIEKLSTEIPHYLDRLGLKPGLTGLAQVVNGYDNNLESFQRKVNLDLLYLQNCCWKNDLKILFRTVGVVLTGKGAL